MMKDRCQNQNNDYLQIFIKSTQDDRIITVPTSPSQSIWELLISYLVSYSHNVKNMDDDNLKYLFYHCNLFKFNGSSSSTKRHLSLGNKVSDYKIDNYDTLHAVFSKSFNNNNIKRKSYLEIYEDNPKRNKSLHVIADKRKMHSAMNYAKNVCILGADNKVEDIGETSGWSAIQRYRYSPGSFKKISKDHRLAKEDQYFNTMTLNFETGDFITRLKNWYYHVNNPESISTTQLNVTLNFTNQNPLFSVQDKGQKNLLGSCLYTLATRHGNCGSRAALVSKYLWENSKGIYRIEVIRSKKFDHVFVAVNRSGEINQSETWNCWVIDSWYKNGVIFRSNKMKKMFQKMREYIIYQKEEFTKKCFGTPLEVNPDKEELYECDYEIRPNIHPYPTHAFDKNKQIEDYYEVISVYPENISNNLKNFKEKHIVNFQQCLNIINSPLLFKQIKLKNNVNGISLLKNVMAINQQDDKGFTSLHLASMNGDIRLVQYLLQKKSDVRIKTKNGHSAIFFAAYNGYHKIVNLLCEYSENSDLINQKDNNGFTPILIAGINGHLKTVKLLIEKYADMLLQTSHIMFLIYYAAKGGNAELLKSLCVRQSIINKDEHDRMPINSQCRLANLTKN